MRSAAAEACSISHTLNTGPSHQNHHPGSPQILAVISIAILCVDPEHPKQHPYCWGNFVSMFQARSHVPLLWAPFFTCSYFNWRQDTSSDLQLFTVLSIVLVLVGGLIKGTLIAQVGCRNLKSTLTIITGIDCICDSI